ncbi:phosphoribosyltransferase [Palleronia sediminis]|uniref:Phosphoribosyltransferase n=1 Tax=Palleronia sediminis TaxID=2547833 RepID=A0A4R6AIA3_9RHOB|nr:phosphoribosyltransferase family protein [Palleronia sediminis]TDL81103.1 phosphoribosyltransferase [Palleronia sediminis]
MHFRSYADLHDDVARGLSMLPDRPDLVVGVPRSGLLAAGIASIILNVPLASIDGLAAGHVFGTGKTKQVRTRSAEVDGPPRVLVLDDSVSTGLSLREARATIAGIAGLGPVTFAAVYGEAASHPEADTVFAAVPQPRMFQWNFLHHDALGRCMIDIDGVLCRDPLAVENDDGPNYRRFLSETPPLLLPSKRVAALVTNRLEKYRPETEAWLARHGVVYDALHMLDLPDAEARAEADLSAFKAETYRRSSALLFIESEIGQAVAIAEATDRPVLCTATWRLKTTHTGAYLARQARRQAAYRALDLPRRGKLAARRIAGRLLGEEAVSALGDRLRRSRDTDQAGGKT